MDERAEAEAFLWRAALVSLFTQEYSPDEDDASALRRALLTFILIVQDEASPAPRYMIDYLLQEFPPLAHRFNAQHRHPLIGTEEVMRARVRDDQLGLLIREEFGTKLLAEAIEVVRESDADE
jgi:hypothetical protein